MQAEELEWRDIFQRSGPLTADSTEEIELAFEVQNSTPDDPELLQRLIDHYAVDLYRWIAALLYLQRRAKPPREEIIIMLTRVFSHAIHHVDQFHGRSSVATWLFGIGYQLIRSRSYLDWMLHLKKPAHQDDDLPAQVDEILWRRLVKLPEAQRTTLILRYLFDLGLAEIASILGIQIIQAHRRLVTARNRILAIAQVSHMELLLQAFLDGIYEEDEEGKNQIVQHIEACQECQSSIQRLLTLEKSLSESLKAYWEPVSLNSQETEALFASVVGTIQQRNGSWVPKIKLGQISWVAGVAILFVGLAFLFIRLTPPESEFPQASVTPTQQLPPIINAQSAGTSFPDVSNGITQPQFLIPAFSSDGQWAVITAVRVDPRSISNVEPTTQLYNRETNTNQIISEGSGMIQLSLAYWVLAPGISGDGQRVVYVTSGTDPQIAGKRCALSGQQACLDVYLYDRQTGTSRQLTQAWDGGAADGTSLAPTISADGQRVAFWSTADNLIEGDVTTPQCKMGLTCLYIYLYNAQNQKLERIQIVNARGNMASGIDRISLSADGRYVGFTLMPASQLWSISPEGLVSPGPTESGTGNTPQGTPAPVTYNASEAVVYDQQTGRFELENQAPDGTPGNGLSSSPVLSADGRYVAFVSASSNLIGGDDNQHSDVFVRDRVTGGIRLVSVSTYGNQGNDDSGLAYWNTSVYSINMSPDGRYILFQSHATNLGRTTSTECSRDYANLCNVLYVHDEQTGQTDLVVAVSNQDYSFFPGISADGHWLTFMQPYYDCGAERVLCSDVMLLDRQTNWTSNLTKRNQELSSLPWSYSASLSLPRETWSSGSFTLSPDGQLLALAGYDSKIRVWHLIDGSGSITQDNPIEVIDTKNNDAFTTVALTTIDGWMAAGTANGRVYVWDLLDARLLYQLNDQVDPIEKIVFPQDGGHLIIATRSKTWIWTINGKELLLENTIDTSSEAVYSLDITPKGDLLATGRGDGTVWLQSLPSGKVIGRLGGLSVAVYGLAFSPDGSVLAARSAGGIIDLWSISLGDPLSPTFDLLNTINSYEYTGQLAISADNKFLASSGMVGRVTLWSLPDAIEYNLSPQDPNGLVYGVVFSQTGDSLAVLFEDQIVIWGVPPKFVSTYFANADKDTYVGTTPSPASSANDIPAFYEANIIERNLSLDEAELWIQFPLMVPTRLPENFKFVSAAIDKDFNVWLTYEIDIGQANVEYLYVYESVGYIPTMPTMTVGASAVVLSLIVNADEGKLNAEYVQGDWRMYTGFSPPSDDSTVAQSVDIWQWDNTSGSQRLRWEQAGVLIGLYYQADDSYPPDLIQLFRNYPPLKSSPLFSQDDLLQIARGMQWYAQARTGLACFSSGQVVGDNSPCLGAGFYGEQYPQRIHNRHVIFIGSIVTK